MTYNCRRPAYQRCEDRLNGAAADETLEFCIPTYTGGDPEPCQMEVDVKVTPQPRSDVVDKPSITTTTTTAPA